MTVDPTGENLAPELWEIGDHVIKFPDYFTGDWITLGDGSNYCSAHMEGLGSPELTANEIQMSGVDGVTFGREYFGARKFTITGAIKSGGQYVPGDPGAAWDSLATLQRAWDYNPTQYDPSLWNPSPVRHNARQVIPLLWKRPNREAVWLYGRPERLDPDVSNAYAGYITYSAVFRQSDPKFYSAEPYSIGVTLVAPYSGGLIMNTSNASSGASGGIFAVDGKLQTTPAVSAPVTTVVGGDTPTNPTITFYGPVLNPKLELLNQYGGVIWGISLLTSIDDGDYVTVDARQWQQTVTRSDGSNLAGALRASRMKDILLPVGQNELVYTGQDSTNTSHCEISYRNAWASV